MRKAAVVVAIVLAVVLLFAALLPRFVSLEDLRPRIQAVLEERTGRKIVFSGISFSMFPRIGVKLSGLVVPGDPGYPGENLLTVPETEVRLALLPLLAGRLEFHRFILRNPEVIFRRYSDGTHSATQIATRLAREDGAARPRSETVRVAVKAVAIENANLRLLLQGEDGRETRWEIKPFSFRLDGIGEKRNRFGVETRIDGIVRGGFRLEGTATRESGAITDPTMFDLEAKGELFGESVIVEGKMSAPMGLAEMDLTVSFPKVEMDRISPVFASPPAVLREASPEGIAKVSIKVSGNLQAMGIEAEADLTRAGWTVGPGIRKFIDAPCTIVAQGHRFPDLLLVSNAEIRFSPLLVIANASYVPSTGAREWTASARIASLAEFAKSRREGISPLEPTGRLTASGKGARASASAKDEWNVGLDLGEVGFQLRDRGLDLRALNGHVDLSPAKVGFHPLAGLLNGQKFHVSGTASIGKSPVGEISLRMPYLDLDALLPPGGAVQEKRDRAKPLPPGDTGRSRPVSARGNLKIDAGKVRGLEFRDLAASGRYEEGNLTLDFLRASAYGGEVSLSGQVRPASVSPDFRARVKMEGVAAEEILSRKTSLGDFLSGTVHLSADLGGGTRDFAEFSRTAAGSGSLRVTGGRIKGIDLVDAAAGLSGLQSLASAPGGRKAAETTFSDLSADFRISGGKIRTDALRIVSEKAALNGSASLGFDRTFDFRGVLSLSPEMSKRARGAAGRFLADSSGRVGIPLVVSGPVTSPAIAIDADALARNLPGKILDGLFDTFLPGEK